MKSRQKFLKMIWKLGLKFKSEQSKTTFKRKSNKEGFRVGCGYLEALTFN